eukprot:TRINITY_DN5974_c0_g1_i2.p1 TRINITY_DN5974_c0_g1~~TRINITY_DN5974_c0_g1_i2.p1  ORF type:complete len:633 (-),score=127.88 TRINITY_DN5974_c0_g1_i2:82-1980(-)
MNLFRFFSSNSTELQESVLGFTSKKKLERVRLCARLSKLVYESNLDIERSLNAVSEYPIQILGFQISDSGFEHCKFVLVEFANYFVLAIAGSKDREDWISNLDHGLTTYKTFRLHTGFMNSYYHIPTSSIDELMLNNPKKEIVITGHSRGGAIAQILAHELVQNGRISCITFGSPLVGCRDWSNAITKLNQDSNFLHFVNSKDPVPHVLLPFGYRPSGKIIVMDSNEKKWVEISIGDYQAWSDEMKKNHFNWNKAIALMSNHLMTEYCMLIEQFMDHHDIWFSSTVTCQTFEKKDLCKAPKIKSVGTKFESSDQLGFTIEGENLSSVIMIRFGFVKHTKEVQTITVPFNPPRTTKLEGIIDIPSNVTMEYMLAITNGFHIIEQKIKLPFKKVLIVGATGAGKTYLKEQMERLDKKMQPSTVNTIRTIPSIHTEEERTSYGNLVEYYEYNGFVEHSPKEYFGLSNYIDHFPPLIVTYVINLAHVLPTRELMKDLASQEKNDSKLFYALTNPYGVSYGVREGTIAEFKSRILELDPNAERERRIFVLNTRQFEISEREWKEPFGLVEFNNRIHEVFDDCFHRNTNFERIRESLLKVFFKQALLLVKNQNTWELLLKFGGLTASVVAALLIRKNG